MTSSAERLTNCNRNNQCDQIDLQDTASSALMQVKSSSLARVFNIQRYSLNDGVGIRTVVFFKGCPHYCPWCSNPESISRKIQIVRRKSKCIKCETCLNDPQECPSGALEKIGYDIDLQSVIKTILKDEVFFRSSGGGVTLSGGEVLMQHSFASQLLNRLQQLGIATAIETAGDGKYEDFLAVAKYCDEVLFDFKIMDKNRAKKTCNIHLDRVLDNFSRLYEQNIHLIPRLPLIPGYTLDEQNVIKVLDFLKPFTRIKEIHILPFHQFGQPKYELIHQQYQLKDIKAPQDEEIKKIKTLIENQGYLVIQGG